MEFSKCNRCGNFYISNSNVCPKCAAKDNLEFSAFKNYIQENGFEESLGAISSETGISEKNLSRFLNYDEFKQFQQENGNINLNNNKFGNNGINLD